MANPVLVRAMTASNWKYYAVHALLVALLRRGFSFERAVALLEAGRWP